MALSGMITSKDIIDTAGISRATLNNYIKFGLLPKPIVGPPPPGVRGAKQIGYFPEDVLARLEHIKLLKGQGRTMEEIVAFLTAKKDDAGQPVAKTLKEASAAAAAGDRRQPAQYSRASDRPPRVTICDIESPAYLINRNFELEWINRQAEDLIFGKKVRDLLDIESRNIFRLFFEQRASVQTVQIDNWTDLTTLHMAVLHSNVNDHFLSRMYRGITSEEHQLLRSIYHSLPASANSEGAFHLPVTLALTSSPRKNFRVHTMAFREGTLFVYLPEDQAHDEIVNMLVARRKQTIGDLLGRRMPSLTSLCVLVAGLQDSARISAELLPTQYFELINGMWECVAPALKSHNAIYGRHAGVGMLCYFIDRPGDNYIINCINCAIELRESMKNFSRDWRGIKGWDNTLCLNTGIHEGQEFFGTIRSGGSVEFAALGDTMNIAASLSEFAKNGEIWATKSVVSKLSREDRNRYCFGVHGKAQPGNGFIRDSFARLSDLLAENNPHYRQLSAIGNLPITEIKERVHPDNA
ncbi:MAG: adenylate/guanylate cyclase domain-containing protein [Desulfobulbaceae bacterium]